MSYYIVASEKFNSNPKEFDFFKVNTSNSIVAVEKSTKF